MVIGTEFVWGHLPKTGGDATARLFELFPEVVVFADPAESHEKHATFAQREALVAGKRRALNIRRLPSWMLSVSLFQSLYGEHPDYRPLPMRSPHEMSRSRLADENLLPFIDGGAAEVHHWLRMEMLSTDFLHFVAGYVQVDDDRRRQVFELGPVNQMGYDRRLAHWFTDEHVARMYEANPVWTAFERALYGDVVTLADAEPASL